jgi:GNAT superfamily N-acetyltransferase
MTRPSRLEAREVPLASIAPLREAYRREMNCQIVHDSWHARGFTRCFIVLEDGRAIGHGAVGGPPRDARDIVKELYLEPTERGRAAECLAALVESSGARRIEAQTNDPILFPLLQAFGRDATSEILLFADGEPTAHVARDVAFRPLLDFERSTVFAHTHEPVGDWALERAGEIVATGGFALHYNPPFADLYMEVAPMERRSGLGRYLIQELRRACREAGRVPAARCHESNIASRATLVAGGLVPCGRIVSAALAP